MFFSQKFFFPIVPTNINKLTLHPQASILFATFPSKKLPCSSLNIFNFLKKLFNLYFQKVQNACLGSIDIKDLSFLHLRFQLNHLMFLRWTEKIIFEIEGFYTKMELLFTKVTSTANKEAVERYVKNNPGQKNVSLSLKFLCQQVTNINGFEGLGRSAQSLRNKIQHESARDECKKWVLNNFTS